MTDLSFQSTDDLIKELVARSEALIIARMPKDNKQNQAFLFGNPATCAGLADMLQIKCRHSIEGDLVMEYLIEIEQREEEENGEPESFE